MTTFILQCAILSGWVYNTRNALPTGIEPILLEKRLAIVLDRHGTCVVTFRGTDSVDDLLEDLLSQTDQHCNDDTGFVKQFEDSFVHIGHHVHERVKNILSLRCNGVVVFTGHSLGGAMATIAPKLYGIVDYKVITFGEPRTCCRGPGVTTMRVVHNRDVIPALPLPWHVHSISHCGATSLHIPSNEYISDFYWPSISTNYDLLDHAMVKYINALYK
jgi:hypothetical protein